MVHTLHRALMAAALAVLATLASLTSAPAQASTTQEQASACRNIQITGGRVAIRDYPFVNGENLRTVRRGTVLRACEFYRGGGANSYPNKCGKRGQNWWKVVSGRTSFTGSPYGYVAATCARAI